MERVEIESKHDSDIFLSGTALRLPARGKIYLEEGVWERLESLKLLRKWGLIKETKKQVVRQRDSLWDLLRKEQENTQRLITLLENLVLKGKILPGSAASAEVEEKIGAKTESSSTEEPLLIGESPIKGSLDLKESEEKELPKRRKRK